MASLFMQVTTLLSAVFLVAGSAIAQERSPAPDQPNQFAIGRRTFFDFGPPFEYYEVFVVTEAKDGSSVQRVTLSAPSDPCLQRAKIEIASALLPESPAALLGASN